MSPGIAVALWCLALTSAPAVRAADSLVPSETDTTSASSSDGDRTSASGEIYVIGTKQQFDSLREVVGRERVGPVAVSWSQLDKLVLESLLSPSRGTELKVRCWIDLSVAGKAALYFADRSSERFLVREIALSRGLAEIDKETLAQIVEMSIVALIDDATLGLTRENVQALLLARSPSQPPPPPNVPAAPSFRPIWRAVVGASYQLESFAPQISWVHGPGAAFGVARHGADTKTSLVFRAAYQVPDVYRGALAGLRLSALRLRVSLMFDVPLDGGAATSMEATPWFGMLLNAGATRLLVEPLDGNTPTSSNIEPKSSIWVPTLGAGFRATQRFGDWSVALGVLADIDLAPVTYDVEVNGRSTRVMRAHSLRPNVLVEVGWL